MNFLKVILIISFILISCEKNPVNHETKTWNPKIGIDSTKITSPNLPYYGKIEKLDLRFTEKEMATGFPYITGSEPFTKLAFQTESQSFIIQSTDSIKNKLKYHQHKNMKIEYFKIDYNPEYNAHEIWVFRFRL